MTFEDLQKIVIGTGTKGFTPLYNPLEDLLLRELRPEYSCFWRFIWRELFGKHQIDNDASDIMAANISLRKIAKGAHIHLNNVSRIAYFFHAAGLISYTPGIKQEQTVSRFQLLPNGLPDLEHIRNVIHTLNNVLDDEKEARADDRHFRFGNNKFMAALAKEHQARTQVV